MWSRNLYTLFAAFIFLFTAFGCVSSPEASGVSTTPVPTTPPSIPTQSALPSKAPNTLVDGVNSPSPQPSKDQPIEDTVYYLSGQRDEEFDQSEIWAVSLDGTNQRLIYQRTRPWGTVEIRGGTSVERWGIEIIDLSPDGQKLVFADLLGYGTEPGPQIWFYKEASVWTINVDGSHLMELVRFTAKDEEGSECVISNIAWSPDSTQILIHRNCMPNRNRPDTIMTVNVLTGEVIEIGSGSGGTWSPDSQHIAYARTRHPADPGDVYGLYVATADGQEKSRIFRWDEFEGYSTPDWSPDGELLVFFDGQEQMYSIAPDGTQLRKLPAKGWTAPKWSPNSKYVAFVGGSNLVLSILEIQQTHVQSFLQEVRPGMVEWSRDSKFLLVQTQGKNGGIYYIRVQDGAKFHIPVSGMMPTW